MNFWILREIMTDLSLERPYIGAQQAVRLLPSWIEPFTQTCAAMETVFS